MVNVRNKETNGYAKCVMNKLIEQGCHAFYTIIVTSLFFSEKDKEEMLTRSKTTGSVYEPSEMVYISNLLQFQYYIFRNLRCYDLIYGESGGFSAAFSIKESKEDYENEWKPRTLKNGFVNGK